MTEEKKVLAPAVFFDTGGGDIYAGRSREDVIKCMREDVGEADFEEDQVEEVDGSTQMRAVDEDEEPTDATVTLLEEYGDDEHAYMIGSTNI